MHLSLPISSWVQGTEKTTETQTLIDSGAEGNFLNKDFAEKNKIDLIPLKRPTVPQNVDGMLNLARKITHLAKVNISFDD
jgi:hypothetical protein